MTWIQKNQPNEFVFPSINAKTMMFSTILTFAVVSSLLVSNVVGIRFVIDREECLSINVEYEGDTVYVSFVVIKAESPWHYSEDGIDLVVIILTPSFSFFLLHVFACLFEHYIYWFFCKWVDVSENWILSCFIG